MTDEEKAHNFAIGLNSEQMNMGELMALRQGGEIGFLNGLAEGRKLGKEEQWKATEKAQKKTSSKIRELEKENEDLAKRMLEQQITIGNLTDMVGKMKCCENCKHHYWNYGDLDCRLNYLCYNTNYDKWELAE